MRPLLACALLALLLPGCSSDEAEPQPAVAAAAAEAAPAMAWAAEAFGGEFTTTAVVNPGLVLGPSLVTVPAAAAEAFFNGTIASPVPDEVTVRLVSPGCDTPDCFVETDSEGGAFSARVEAPEAGEWNVVFFAKTAAQSGTWEIEVNALV